MNHANTGPRRWYYALAGGIFVAGITGFVLLLLITVAGFAGSMTQVVVPGEAILELDKPGDYTVFHEYRSMVDGRIYNIENVSGLSCQLTPEGSAAEIPLSSATMNSTYSYLGREAKSVLTFSVDEPGRYTFSCAYSEGAQDPETVLAVGQLILWKFVGGILGSIASLFLAIGGGITVAVVTFVKREKARKAAA